MGVAKSGVVLGHGGAAAAGGSAGPVIGRRHSRKGFGRTEAPLHPPADLSPGPPGLSGRRVPLPPAATPPPLSSPSHRHGPRPRSRGPGRVRSLGRSSSFTHGGRGGGRGGGRRRRRGQCPRRTRVHTLCSGRPGPLSLSGSAALPLGRRGREAAAPRLSPCPAPSFPVPLSAQFPSGPRAAPSGPANPVRPRRRR